MVDRIGPITGYETIRVNQGGHEVEVDLGTVIAGTLSAGPDQANLQAAVDPYINANGPVQNMTPANTRKARTAYAKYRAGLSDFTVAIVGCSYIRGTDAGAGNDILSSPYVLGKKLMDRGEQVDRQIIIGSGNNSSDVLPTRDSRITRSGPWTADAVSILGGRNSRLAATGSETFAPLEPVDTFEYEYYSTPGQGSFSWAINGGAATTVSAAGSPNQTKVLVIPVTMGINTCQISWVSGTFALFRRAGYNKSRKCIRIMNCGSSGANSAQITAVTGADYDPMAQLARHAPHLTLIEGGIGNDWRQNTGTIVSAAQIAATLASLRTQFDTALLSGDAMAVIPVFDGDPAVNVNQALFCGLLRQVATEKGCAIIDNQTWRGPYSGTNGLYADTVHGTPSGYQDDASLFLQALPA